MFRGAYYDDYTVILAAYNVLWCIIEMASHNLNCVLSFLSSSHLCSLRLECTYNAWTFTLKLWKGNKWSWRTWESRSETLTDTVWSEVHKYSACQFQLISWLTWGKEEEPKQSRTVGLCKLNMFSAGGVGKDWIQCKWDHISSVTI